jgi:hypothetical protein
MATTVTIYDPVTRNSRTINIEIDSAIVQGVDDGGYDYYVRLSTSAKDANGDSIATQYIKDLNDFPDTGGRHDGSGSTTYESLTVAIQDYIRHMVEGDGSGTEMSFTL